MPFDEKIYKLMREPCPYHIGSRVKVNPTTKYAPDFPGTFIIVAIIWEYQKSEGLMNIWIASEDEIKNGYGATTNFRIDDLLPA